MYQTSHQLTRHVAALFFPAALILYDFSAYLATDLIQPGALRVVRGFSANVTLAPTSVSLYMTGGMALQRLLGPFSNRIGWRPVLPADALTFTLACPATLSTTSMTQFLVVHFVQSTSIYFIITVGYVTVQEAFEEKGSIRLVVVVTSVVLVVPTVGPLSGAALTHLIHWKVLFGIIAATGLVAWFGLLLTIPGTVRRGDVSFSLSGVLRNFCATFRNCIFLLGTAMLSSSYIPLMSWVTISPVILMDAGELTTSKFAQSQIPVFSAVITANLLVTHQAKNPTRPRFVFSAAPIQILGPAILIVGNLVWPHVWLWSMLGTCFYAFGIGLTFPTLSRFTLSSSSLSRGTVSVSLDIVILSISALSIEGVRWLWSHGGRLPFYPLAVTVGIVVACCPAGPLRHQRQCGQTVIEVQQS